MITKSIDLSKNSFLHPVHAYRVFFLTQSQPGNNEHIANMPKILYHVHTKNYVLGDEYLKCQLTKCKKTVDGCDSCL